jgi:hypothetical protein
LIQQLEPLAHNRKAKSNILFFGKLFSFANFALSVAILLIEGNVQLQLPTQQQSQKNPR